MAILDVRGFDFGKGLLGEAADATRLLSNAQTVQQQQLQTQQMQGQAQRQAQIRELLGQIGQPQPAGQPTGQDLLGPPGQEPGAPIEPIQAPIPSQEELISRARRVDPGMANKTLTDMGLDDSSKRAEMSRFAADLQNTPFNLRQEKIKARAENLKAQGRDPTQTIKLLDLNEEQQNQGLIGVQLMDLSTKERFGVQERADRQRQATQRAFAPVTIVNAAGEKRLVSPTVDTLTGAAKLSPFDIPEGFSISKETDAEKRTADVVSKSQEEAAKVTGKSQAKRRQLQIDKGLEAAEGMANIQRAMDLLDTVETGGIDAASLRAKQFFGVEGADEAELSNRMGKAVLSQLRATFGAAFTAEEGASLARIEAGFGKSTKGNRRLLEQAKRLIQRAARRGIRAARKQGDLDTVKDIEDALAFRLDIDQKAAPKPTDQPKAKFLGFE